MPKIDPAKLSRFRALFTLGRLSPTMQSDVLSDGTIAKRLKLSVSNPVTLAGSITFDRTELFELFQKAADAQELPAQIEDTKGTRHPIRIEIDGDAAIVTFAGKAIRFPQAALLTSNVEKRRATADICLAQHILTIENRREFEALVNKKDRG